MPGALNGRQKVVLGIGLLLFAASLLYAPWVVQESSRIVEFGPPQGYFPEMDRELMLEWARAPHDFDPLWQNKSTPATVYAWLFRPPSSQRSESIKTPRVISNSVSQWRRTAYLDVTRLLLQWLAIVVVTAGVVWILKRV